MKYPLFAAVVTCALWLCAATAFAKPPHATRSSAPPHPASLEQAVRQVQRKTGGHILAADSVTRGSNKVYRIKVLTPQGRVRVMQLHSRHESDSSRHESDSGSGNHHSGHGGH